MRERGYAIGFICYQPGMSNIDPNDQKYLEPAENLPLLDRTLHWSKTNSGTTNLDGLNVVAQQLGDAFSSLPGELELVEPDPVDAVRADGSVEQVERGRHLHAKIRPDAPVQILLTGHMDTVFPADHPFQNITELESGVLNGPGLADMKGGLSVMLGALQIVEQSDLANRIGYEIMINSDEEVGSASSANLIKRCAEGKDRCPHLRARIGRWHIGWRARWQRQLFHYCYRQKRTCRAQSR